MKVIFYLIFAILAVYLIVVLFGIYLKNRGQKPLQKELTTTDGWKFATNTSGRTIAYIVFGELAPTNQVMITIHGSGPEALCEANFHRTEFLSLKVKGIAISLPGYGYTDENPGRIVKNWPQEDLAPVLDQEKVTNFMIMGHSQGTVHAMAAAYQYPERCIGMGLNAPLLSLTLSNELGLKGAIGSSGLYRTSSLKKNRMGWYWTLLHITTVTLSPFLPVLLIKKGMKDSKEAATIEEFGASMRRSVVRGVNVWETALDVCYEWGFDPREITCNNICIWHAADDTWCPPEIGRWMASYYRAQSGVKVDFKQDNLGYNHFTYVTKQFLDPRYSMTKTLLDQLKNTE